MEDRRSFFVTGCASGIGCDLAEALIELGARVTATDVNYDGLMAAARERGWPDDRVLYRRLDVTSAQAWAAVTEAAVDRFEQIDVLVNVAGVLTPGWIHEVDVRAVELMIDVNVKGVALGMRTVAPQLVERGAGHIINVASMAALAPIEGIAVYSATKYAVRGLSLAAGQELRRRGVDVTVICPDAVRTPMLELQRERDEAAMTFSGPRELEPSEVTDAILDALGRRPIEVFLPRSRGWLARLADVFPGTARSIAPYLRKKGLARQRGPS
jgi:3-oxoacyl-[acyl-carrier protein] reductase